MEVLISPTSLENGQKAAEFGASKLREAISAHGSAHIIVATGASQFEMLHALVQQKDVAWNRVTVFHLDEYVGLPLTHPASFRKYLWERFHSKLPLPVNAFHYIAGDENPEKECARLSALIAGCRIDVCFAGIGENAHLAFNDPPADFETEYPYLLVNLDEACRRQQLGEGWFASIEDVPRQAISMSIRQILKSMHLVITVPDQRKANAVLGTLEGSVTNRIPSSILQTHPDTHLFLDLPAASLLSRPKH